MSEQQPKDWVPPTLAELAVLAAEERDKEENAKLTQRSRDYVQSIVGEKLMDQCEQTWSCEWVIGGSTFRYFDNDEEVDAPSPAPCLGVWQGARYYRRVASLADIGQAIRQNKAIKKAREEAKASPPAVIEPYVEESGFWSWLKRLNS